MRNLARRDARSSEVLALARECRDPWGLDQWLRQTWHIVPDPSEAEYIQSPAYQIRCGGFAGDCDDAATLAASVLIVFQVPAFFFAVRQPSEEEFSHVFVRVPAYGLDIDPIVPAYQIPIRYGEAMILEV